MMEASPEPEIRRGTSTDLPSMVSLLNSVGLPTADLASADQLQLWIAESDKSLHGVVALQRFGSEALLRSLAVSPDHRQRGLGRKLVSRIEHDAKADGVERLILLTETAEQFFRKLRYDVINRSLVSGPVSQSAEFRSLCPASAVCMRKALGS